MKKINWTPILTLLKIILPILLICSIIGNFLQWANYDKVNSQLINIENINSKKDTLLSTILSNDGLVVSEFLVNNNPEIGLPLLKQKIDSITGEGIIKDNNFNVSKGGFYTKSKYTASLKNAKATFESDSLAEYKNDNWYIGYNKKESIFNAEYQGEQEVITSFVPKYNFGKFSFGPEELRTLKWSTDPSLKIIESETIYVPTLEKNVRLEAYLNSEYRQGIKFSDKKLSAIDNSASGHIGAGLDLRIKKHKIGLEANYKLFGNEYLPDNEVKLKYQYYLFK